MVYFIVKDALGVDADEGAWPIQEGNDELAFLLFRFHIRLLYYG